jgi:hypothetical protein
MAFHHLSSFSQPVNYLTASQSSQAPGAATPIDGAPQSVTALARRSSCSAPAT